MARPLVALPAAISSKAGFQNIAHRRLDRSMRLRAASSGGAHASAIAAAAAARNAANHNACSSRPRILRTAASSSDANAATAAEAAVRHAAALLADTFLRDEITVGVGTGLGVNCVLEELAHRLESGKLRGVRCVPASDAAASEAAFHGLPLTTLQAAPKLDLFIEVADELDCTPEGNLAFIIGRRPQPAQPQLHRARELAAAAVTNIVMADEEAVLVPRLGGTLPVAVEEEGWEDVGEELDDIFLGDAELWRRSTEEGAGPRGGDSPYVSAEGHALIDIKFYEGLKMTGEDADYSVIASEIEGVPGVVAHGLMSNVAAAAVVAGRDGPRLMACVTLYLAVAACLAASAAAQLPPFSNPGGPPFLNGPAYETNDEYLTAMGWIMDGQYAFVYPAANTSAGIFATVLGEYTSWECGTENGTYLAIVNRTTMLPNGTRVEQQLCEYGTGVGAGRYFLNWAQQEGSCPTETTESLEFYQEFADSAICGTPDFGTSFNNQTAPLELLMHTTAMRQARRHDRQMARVTLYLAVAACLAASAAAQLPALSTAGAPPFLSGPINEFSNDPGSVSAVGWIKDGTFVSTYPANGTAGGYVTVMGEYTSWQCGTENGTYQAIVNRTTIQPNGTRSQQLVCEYGSGVGSNYIERAQQAGACPTVTTHTIQLLEAGTELQPTCGVTDSGFGSSSQTGASVTSGATGPTGSTGVTGTTDAYDSAPSEAP
ncbi:putative ribose-5-phosphate isomerase 4 [Chlorella vulgaris]